MSRTLSSLFAALVLSSFQIPAAGFSRPDKQAPQLFVWTDTCNVYVIKEGPSALLINLGDGTVLEHLTQIGVNQIDWVLFTDHHREQCQGGPKLGSWRSRGTKIAGPLVEQALFEHPQDFRKMDVKLGDAFTIHGASFVRPPITPITFDRALATNDTFVWRGHEITCLDTRGASPGGISYLLKMDNRILAFTGDVMLEGAKMHTWFDTEWDYGFAAGIQALRKSVARLNSLEIAQLFPSHGPSVRNTGKELSKFANKLERLEKLYVRGYGVEAASAAYQDKVSKPTVVSNVFQVSPHLFKFKRTNFWPNFSLILGDDGHALLSDCGLLNESFLDAALEGMRANLGLKAIDAIVISHMHGDHFLEATHLREKWGAQIWALDNMVDKMEHPERFDYSAPIQAYGKKGSDGALVKGVRVDRAFKPGGSFMWDGRKFTIDWMPGQTEFALCLHGQIDGRKIAFTGDNIFGDPDDPSQTGHEAMVAHNSAILEEGYIYGAEYLRRLKPDLLMGGHSFVMDHPAQFIERYRKWSYQMRAAFQALSSEKDYRYWFDPFWVRTEPYRSVIKVGQSVELQVHLRNFNSLSQRYRVEIHTPAGLRAHPAVVETRLAPEARGTVPLRLSAAQDLQPGVH
ncbi:MAG TPA: MBL fold metallo-hydrolase, partial [Candidatus Saccharimonadales bacterium]|nr:MBL fold metallo-hydrolase [Candidatus Saccharimonadales bacterium]